MKQLGFGALDAIVCGGDDGDGGGDGPIVVLLHGFGAPGDDLVVFSQILETHPRTRFVFPAAPLELGGPYGDGRAWWMIDLDRVERDMARGTRTDRSRELPDGLPAMRAAVTSLVELVRTQLGDASPLILGGFSQGAMLACDVALHLSRPPDALVLLSGTLIAETVWKRQLARLVDRPVFQSHGRGDPLLPFAAAERLRDLLQHGGAKVSWHPFDGGHEIPPAVCDALGRFITQLGE